MERASVRLADAWSCLGWWDAPDRRLADPQDPRQVAGTFTAGPLLGHERPLSDGQNWTAAELHAAGFGPSAAVAGAGPDEFAFELGQAA